MRAEFGPTQAGKERLRTVRAGLPVAVANRMIDAAHFVMLMQRVPSHRLVGMDDCAGLNALHHFGDRSAFGRRNVRNRAALALAHDNNALALARLIFREATVLAVLFVVRGFDVTAEVRAVDFDRAGQRGVRDFGRHRLAKLVLQNERRPILHVEIARELEGAVPLRAVRENGNRGQHVLKRKLAAGEDGRGRGGELGRASLALENPARGELVDFDAAALRADRLAAVVGPSDRREHLERLVLGKPHDLGEGEGAGLAGKEEMLCHLPISERFIPKIGSISPVVNKKYLVYRYICT